jgi:isopenicillin N synthase-like dioxygenase
MLWFFFCFQLVIFSSIVVSTCQQQCILGDDVNAACFQTTNKKSETPPTIDIAALIKTDGATTEERQALVHIIGMACRHWGFFHIINHGIDGELVRSFQRQMHLLFKLSTSEKQKIKRTVNNSRGFADDELTKQKMDSKQIFDVGGRHESLNTVLDGFNQWPSSVLLPDFRRTVEAYYEANVLVASRLLEIISEDLGVDNFVFAEAFQHHSSFLRLNYYPVRNHEDFENDSGMFGVSRHTDAGVLTLLLQDSVSALEVYSGSKEDNNDGVWVAVDPVADGITVNTGDMLQIFSNDRYRAPEHRVQASTKKKERYSAPFFYNPRYDAAIEPLVTSKDDSGQRKRYRKVSWGEFRSRRFQGDIENRGKEVQIEDYKVEEA